MIFFCIPFDEHMSRFHFGEWFLFPQALTMPTSHLISQKSPFGPDLNIFLIGPLTSGVPWIASEWELITWEVNLAIRGLDLSYFLELLGGRNRPEIELLIGFLLSGKVKGPLCIWNFSSLVPGFLLGRPVWECSRRPLQFNSHHYKFCLWEWIDNIRAIVGKSIVFQVWEEGLVPIFKTSGTLHNLTVLNKIAYDFILTLRVHSKGALH
jgi:hypothetical protein